MGGFFYARAVQATPLNSKEKVQAREARPLWSMFRCFVAPWSSSCHVERLSASSEHHWLTLFTSATTKCLSAGKRFFSQVTSSLNQLILLLSCPDPRPYFLLHRLEKKSFWLQSLWWLINGLKYAFQRIQLIYIYCKFIFYLTFYLFWNKVNPIFWRNRFTKKCIKFKIKLFLIIQ